MVLDELDLVARRWSVANAALQVGVPVEEGLPGGAHPVAARRAPDEVER
ncbi:hypothetical protein [Streptomyces sp. G45]